MVRRGSQTHFLKTVLPFPDFIWTHHSLQHGALNSVLPKYRIWCLQRPQVLYIRRAGAEPCYTVCSCKRRVNACFEQVHLPSDPGFSKKPFNIFLALIPFSNPVSGISFCLICSFSWQVNQYATFLVTQLQRKIKFFFSLTQFSTYKVHRGLLTVHCWSPQNIPTPVQMERIGNKAVSLGIT